MIDILTMKHIKLRICIKESELKKINYNGTSTDFKKKINRRK